jgi:hypothetical protein
MNGDTVRVHLEWYEAEQAIYVGGRREAEALRRNIDKPQYSRQESVENHIQSAGAEKAVAKRLNLDWHASINTFADGVADVGGAIEVRYRRLDYELKVRERDHDDRYFVLVRGALPDYEIIGWLKGKDAKRPEWWKDPGLHGPAFFVPDPYLKPALQLPVSKVRIVREEADMGAGGDSGQT